MLMNLEATPVSTAAYFNSIVLEAELVDCIARAIPEHVVCVRSIVRGS